MKKTIYLSIIGLLNCFFQPFDSFSSCTVSIINPNNIICNGSCTGSLTAVANGVPSFHYLWSTNDTTATINNLCAGNYTVLMTDNVGCTDTATITVTEPPLLVPIVTTNYYNCQCIHSITATGGTPGYTYLWCDGSVAQQMVNCSPGICIVDVVDANGCFVQDTFLINPPPPLILTLQSTGTTCAGCSDGSASATASGGTGPYFYTWSSGETTSTISGISSGIHTVCVTDANNCTVCDTISVADDPTTVFFTIENSFVKIYPNPFSDETILEVNAELLKSNPEFIIFDLLENKLISFPLHHLRTIIDRKNLASGVYFYQLQAAGWSLVNGKLVIVD